MLKVRKATPNDAKIIAKINVDTWKVCYKGMLPDDFLKNRNLTDDRIIAVENKIKQKDTIYFVAEYNNEVIGFCHGGDKRDKDYPFKYELVAIYVLPSMQNKGAGKALLNEFKKAINNEPFYLYALKQNLKAHKFYQKNGGKELPVYKKILPQKDFIVEEVLFAFNYESNLSINKSYLKW